MTWVVWVSGLVATLVLLAGLEWLRMRGLVLSLNSDQVPPPDKLELDSVLDQAVKV